MDSKTLDAFMAQLGQADGETATSMMRIAESVAKRAKADFGLRVDDAEYVLKDAIPDVQNIGTADAVGNDRFAQSLITTIVKDRDNEVILPEGAILDDYRELPMVLYGHRYNELGMGRNAWIVANEKSVVERMFGLIAKTIYVSSKANPFAEQVYQWRVEGMPMGESIGFVPVESVTPDDGRWEKLYGLWVKRATAFWKTKGREITDELLEGVKRIYTKWIQLEYSDVMVPSNPLAVTLAVKKGMIEESEVDFYTIKSEPGTEIAKAEIAIPFLEGKHPLEKEYNLMHDREVGIELGEVDKDVHEFWNKSLTDEFDISDFDEASLDFDNEVYTRFLKCQVKNIYVSEYGIPSPLIGTYLSAIQAITSQLTIKDTRRFSSSGKESPPKRSLIQLNSKKSGRFLVSGTEFCHTESGIPIVKDFYMSWGGLTFSLIVQDEHEPIVDELMSNIHRHADSNHMLKGEKFALSGEFLSKTDDDWDGLVIAQKDKQAIQKSLAITTEKYKSRGLLFVGPPGTGKTKAGRTIMNDTDNTFIWMSARDFLYGWPSSILSLAFDMGRKLAPSVLFMEDIDADLDTDLIKTELDGLRTNAGIVTILTTNFPERLPDALIDRPGRFHHVINFALPTASQRKEMLDKWTSGIEKALIDDIITLTDGYSGAHLRHLVDYALQIAEDETMPIGEALIESMMRMNEQREMIANLKKGKSYNESIIRETVKKLSLGIKNNSGPMVFSDEALVKMDMESDDTELLDTLSPEQAADLLEFNDNLQEAGEEIPLAEQIAYIQGKLYVE